MIILNNNKYSGHCTLSWVFPNILEIKSSSVISCEVFYLSGVNADKSKYMVMSRDQNSGRGYSMKTDNSSIERVEKFKYVGTTLTSKNSIQEEIKSRLKLGNACCYLVHNLLSSSFYPKS
jgi:hypothetical protein